MISHTQSLTVTTKLPAPRPLLLCLALFAARRHAPAQQSVAALSQLSALPDAPSAFFAPQGPAAHTSALSTDAASISGVVVDFSHAAIPSASVTLTDRNGVVLQTLNAGARGEFTFPHLAPGVYRVQVTAANMGTYVSAELELAGARALDLSEVALAVGSTRADVQVITSQQQIAEEQVKEQEHQRVLGILPNFYTSYIWNAAPLVPSQKYRLALHSAFDPVTLLAVAAGAGIEQATNTYPAYHQGAEGYFKRLGSGYAGTISSRLFDSAIFPSLFHQDPRFFWKGRGTTKQRLWYAATSAVVTRGDNGHNQPNYSYILGGFFAGALAQTYHPAADRGVGLLLQNGLLAIGGHAANDILREFLLRHLTSVPDYKNGEPPPASPKPTTTP